jgi:zinc transport system substrate-binding protein
MKAKSFVLSLLFAGSTFLYGCNAETNNDETKKANDALMIYTTVYPLQDFASKIGGEYVNVQSVYPPGVEAHTFEPTPKTMQALADADAFIYVGEEMEGFVDQAIKTLKNEDVKLVEGAKGIELLDSTHEHHDEDEEEHDHSADADEHEETHEDEHHHGDKDPHVWLDPVRSITIAENIKNALVELKPEAKDTFEKNFTALKKDLENLDQQFQTVVKGASKKEILVSHAAYGYWEERYGIEQISVAGLSPTNEPSQKELTNIIKTAKQHGIKYILFEQNVTPKVAEIVKNEIGAEALRLHNLESLTDEDIQKNKDYMTIMKENLEVLKKALN